mmetsp:Transcript_5628/g.17730  ORF Transcript_5628/g.17730 Transcript_5628/m.17730 type:complete len:343 (-) Transcript_5628:33-1061(-)
MYAPRRSVSKAAVPVRSRGPGLLQRREEGHRQRGVRHGVDGAGNRAAPQPGDAGLPNNRADAVAHALVRVRVLVELAPARCELRPLDLVPRLDHLERLCRDARRRVGEGTRGEGLRGAGRRARVEAEEDALVPLEGSEVDGGEGPEAAEGHEVPLVQAAHALVPRHAPQAVEAVAVAVLDVGALRLQTLFDDVDGQPHDATHRLGEEAGGQVHQRAVARAAAQARGGQQALRGFVGGQVARHARSGPQRGDADPAVKPRDALASVQRLGDCKRARSGRIAFGRHGDGFHGVERVARHACDQACRCTAAHIVPKGHGAMTTLRSNGKCVREGCVNRQEMMRSK